MIDTTGLKAKFEGMWPHLDERTRRLVAASEAVQLGRGGIATVSRACGLSRITIAKGISELSREPLEEKHVRRSGGGRKKIEMNDTSLLDELDKLVEPLTRGDPESALRWTLKSTRILAKELTDHSHPISHEKVAQLLRSQHYSLQGNRKTEEGNDHPDRNEQFLHINHVVRVALMAGEPVISVDTKKKELIGNYYNKGHQWRKEKTPEPVNDHDFPTPEVPRAFPYGIYDIGQNSGFVKIGTDHDTSSCAVASIRGWWSHEGKHLYSNARYLVITADSGGSDGYRVRRWKFELQKLADKLGIGIVVCHFPPGTSTWNKVEHRLFSFISSNWRGEPLRDYETIVNLIAGTTTTTGLKVSCYLDHRTYPLGKKVSDQEMASLTIEPDAFHSEWNYTIKPRQ